MQGPSLGFEVASCAGGVPALPSEADHRFVVSVAQRQAREAREAIGYASRVANRACLLQKLDIARPRARCVVLPKCDHAVTVERARSPDTSRSRRAVERNPRRCGSLFELPTR